MEALYLSLAQWFRIKNNDEMTFRDLDLNVLPISLQILKQI